MPSESTPSGPASLLERLDAVQRLTGAAGRADSLEGIYAAALDAVEQALDVDRAAILVVDPDGVMRFKAWRGLSGGYRRATEGHSPWPPGTRDPEPVFVTSVRDDPRLGDVRRAVLAEGIEALAFFPLVQSGRLLGKFMAYHRRPHEFTPAEVMLARIIAGHVAFAVERRHVEDALRAREQDLADLFENASVGLHCAAADGTILRANRAELEMLGYAPDEYVGRHIATFHVYRAVIDDILERLRRGETVRDREARMRHRDGSIRHVLISANALWEHGRLVHTRCFTRDVTDLRGAAEMRQRLAAIVDSSDDAIVSKDLDGIIQTWNRGAERLFGYSAEEAIGQPITIVIPPEHLSEEWEILDRLRRGLRIDHYETVRVRKDGQLVDISLTISPVYDGHGRVIGASKIARDITAWKRAEKEREEMLAREQRARAEAEAANRAKDDFLATLSHEMRTPLNAILGWTQVLSGARHDPDTVTRALETITRNAKQQARLIEDLLDLSTIMGGRLRLNRRPVDLVAALVAALETIRPAADAKQLAVVTRFDPAVGPVTGDPERLQQVFWNLLSNAVKFTPRHGRVTVELTRVRSRAVVTVADTGIGFRQEILPIIFERFRQADSSITRAHGGLGLGLAIVRQLVELHGGTVEASSPGEGQGATFTVALPLAPVREFHPALATLPAGDVGRCDGVHTLLVDDEEDGRGLLAVFLERCGGEVTAVGSAAEALAALARRRPDVLVSDIAMPGTDGYQLIRQIRRLPDGATIPAIALTAHASADARVQAFQAGFDTYLTKPVDPVELLAVVIRLARRPAQA
jgi:PAS domain S-box-containing protein